MSFDFLELFNAVGVAQKPITKDFIPAETLDVEISEGTMGLDSLDITLTFVILGEAYGIPEDDEMNDLWPVSSIGALQEFIMEHKTQDPEDEFDSIEQLVRELA